MASLSLAGCAGHQAASGGDTRFLHADHPAIEYAGYAKLTLTRDRATFERPFSESPFRLDNPGATVTLVAAGPVLSAHVGYLPETETDRSPIGRAEWKAYGGTGVLLVDGERAGTFGRPGAYGGPVRVPLPADLTPGQHRYQLVMPYRARVYFRGFTVYPQTRLGRQERQPTALYVAYGDSITQGVGASDTVHTFPWLVAHKKGWQLVNMGYAGRKANDSDASALVSLEPDVVTVLLGVNDCFAQVPAEEFKNAYRGTIRQLLTLASGGTRVYAITPLRAPGHLALDEALEPYREAVRAAVVELGHPSVTLLEGPKLLPGLRKYFPQDGIHPGDLGFAVLAAQLAQAMGD